MKIKLASVGNPDFGQDESQALPGVPSKLLEKVPSFAVASVACRQYIRHYGLGGGNWSGGQVYDDAGKLIARVSYNGRVWPPDSWKPGMMPLWEATCAPT